MQQLPFTFEQDAEAPISIIKVNRYSSPWRAMMRRALGLFKTNIRS